MNTLTLKKFTSDFPNNSYIKQVWATKYPANKELVKEVYSSLQCVPEKRLPEVISRLHAKKNIDFWTVSVELYFLKYFAKKFKPTIHPKVEGTRRRPEMKLKAKDYEFTVEVRTLFEEDSDRITNQILYKITESVKSKMDDKLPYHVSIHTREDLQANYKYSDVAKHICRSLTDFQKKKNQTRTREKDMEINGVKFNITISPIGSGLSFGYGRSISIDSQNKIQKVIKNKSLKYGKISSPFVIVIDSKDSSKFGRYQIENALFGRQVISWKVSTLDGSPVGDEQPIASRDNSGILKYDKFTRISAIVYHELRLFDAGNRHIIRVYHNPYASNPLSQDVFSGIPQFIPVMTSENSGHLEWINDSEI